MATAGKAVLASGLTVIAALLAVMLVPVPTFRSVPLGIVLAVLSVLAATLTLLPAALSALGHRINGGRMRLRSAADHRSERFAGLGPPPVGAAAARTAPPRSRSCCCSPRPRSDCGRGCRRSPSSRTTPARARVSARWSGRSGRARRARSRSWSPSATLARARGCPRARPGHRGGHARAASAAAARCSPPSPTAGEGSRELRSTIDAVRGRASRRARWSAARPPRTATSSARSCRGSRSWSASILGLGFLLLVALLRAPLAAAAAVALNLLATAAAFGVARLVFQDGALERLLGFESQGFVDAWAPIFFFALVFALAMDYTVFLLATVKEAYDRTRRRPRGARRGPGRHRAA